MKYYSVSVKSLGLKKEARKSLEGDLTSLDKAILEKASGGSNIVRIISTGKPFVNQFGSKEFASTNRILAAVRKLRKLKLLERR